jgi:hypothetical protein
MAGQQRKAGDEAMTDENNPQFYDISIENKYILRFQKTWQQRDGQYAYACIGTIKDLESMQEHLDEVFPRSAKKS